MMPDPRVQLILGRPFLRTARALIDVHGEKITLRHDDQSVTFKVGFSKVLANGNSTPYLEPIVDTTSPTLTPFGVGDNKLPVIIAKDLSVWEKAALIKVQSHKRAIAWKLLRISGNKCTVYTTFCPQESLYLRKILRQILLRSVLLLQACDFYISLTRTSRKLAADHLSRLENPHENELDPKEINEKFPLETLSSIAVLDASTPWFADIANYHAGNFVIKGMSTQQKRKFFKDPMKSSWLATDGSPHQVDITVLTTQQEKSTNPILLAHNLQRLPMIRLKAATHASVKEKFHNGMKCHKIPSKSVKSLTSGALTLWGHSHHPKATNTS
ncbi:hypothetical protein Tco_0037957 [Tanacetum coccineum]